MSVTNKTSAKAIGKVISLFKDPKLWVKGSYHKQRRGVDCFCLVGGLQFAIDGTASNVAQSAQYFAAKNMVENVVRERTGKESIAIEKWNDRRSTRYEDVMSVLRSAKRRFENASRKHKRLIVEY